MGQKKIFCKACCACDLAFASPVPVFRSAEPEGAHGGRQRERNEGHGLELPQGGRYGNLLVRDTGGLR